MNISIINKIIIFIFKKMKIKIPIFFLLFSIYLCQNIITSWNYDKVQMYDIQKINKFLTTKLVDLCYDLPSTIPKLNNIEVTNLKLINVETNLYDSYFNYNNGLFLLTPNKVTFYFNFSFSESTNNINGIATLELKIKVLKINILNDIISKKVTIISKMSSPPENYNIPGIENKDFLKLLKETIVSGFQEKNILNKSIPEKINSGLLNYYKDFFSKKKEFKIITNSFFGNFSFSTKNNKFDYFCEDILAEYKNIFCYFSGYSNKDEDNKDKTKIPLSNERFSHNNDSFIIFVNKDLIYDSLDYISMSYFYFYPKIYNNKTNIKQLTYDFKISYLKKYFNGLQNFNDNDYFYCEIYIDKITLNEINYRVKFILNEKDFILDVTSKIVVDIPIIKNIRFNLCLKDAKSSKIEVISYSTDSKIEIINLEGLKNVIDESFDFDYNKLCLTDEGITLRDYFDKIKDIYIKEEGLYFEGNNLYQ